MHTKRIYSIILMIFLGVVLSNQTAYSQNNNYYSQNNKFNIKLKNGNTITTKSKLFFDNELKKNYLKFQKEKIFPEHTSKIYFIGQRDTIFGFPQKNGWLFRLIPGEIKFYSFNPISNDNFIEESIKKGNAFLNWKDTIFIQSSTDELEKLLMNKPIVYKYYKKKKNLHRLSVTAFTSLLIGGIAMTLTGGIANNDRWFTTGAIISGSALPFFIIMFPTHNFRTKAIRKFNQKATE